MSVNSNTITPKCKTFFKEVLKKQLQSEELLVEYICGEHFCKKCGDCIACYGNERCSNGGMHYY